MFKIILNIFYNPIDALKKIIEQNKNIYVPVNGGSSLRGDVWCGANLNFDDTGDNISGKNDRLNEMTAVYWFWKHMA